MFYYNKKSGETKETTLHASALVMFGLLAFALIAVVGICIGVFFLTGVDVSTLLKSTVGTILSAFASAAFTAWFQKR